jgi:hypothetical protein
MDMMNHLYAKLSSYNFSADNNIDKLAVLKLTTVLIGLYGVVTAMAPHLENELYGLKSTSIHRFITVNSSTAMYTSAIAWWACVVLEMDANKALGIAAVPWALKCCHAILNRRPQEVGYPYGVEVLKMAMFATIAYTSLNEVAHAEVLRKVLATLGLAAGLRLFFKPVHFGKMNGTLKQHDELYSCTKVYGVNISAFCLFSTLVMTGFDSIVSAGIIWIFVGLCLASMLYMTKDFEVERKTPIFLWILFLNGMGIYALVG